MFVSRRFALAASLVLTLGASPAVADKSNNIRTLIELTNASGMASQMAGIMLQGIEPLIQQTIASAEPGVDANRITAIMIEEINAEFERSADQLVSATIPIWDRHMSEAEIHELIQFYRTPLGQKLIQVQPQIIQESNVALQPIGLAVAERAIQSAMERLVSEGLVRP